MERLVEPLLIITTFVICALSFSAGLRIGYALKQEGAKLPKISTPRALRIRPEVPPPFVPERRGKKDEQKKSPEDTTTRSDGDAS